MNRVPFIAMCLAVLVVHSAAAQSKRGTWVGTSVTQQGPQTFIVVLDSAAPGWRGAAVAPATTKDSMRLVDVSVRSDSIEFGIPFNGVTIYITGVVVGDKFAGQIWRQNTNVGSVQLTHRLPSTDKPPSSGGVELKQRSE